MAIVLGREALRHASTSRGGGWWIEIWSADELCQLIVIAGRWIPIPSARRRGVLGTGRGRGALLQWVGVVRVGHEVVCHDRVSADNTAPYTCWRTPIHPLIVNGRSHRGDGSSCGSCFPTGVAGLTKHSHRNVPGDRKMGNITKCLLRVHGVVRSHTTDVLSL